MLAGITISDRARHSPGAMRVGSEAMRPQEPHRGAERFRSAIEAAPNAMLMVDRQGTIVLVNAAAETLFGCTREQLLGQAVEILMPEQFRARHARFREEFFQHPRTRPMGAGPELYARRQNGSQFPAEISLNPIDTGGETWVLATVVDISERRRAEEHFQMVVEASPTAMLMVDHEGKIVMVNAPAAALFGFEREELAGRPIEILVPEQTRKSHAALRHGFAAAPSVRPMGLGHDLHACRKDGSQFPVEVGLNPIETAGGTWVLATVMDISFHRQKLESVGVLAGGIAHDFNNLLGSILADTELAISELAAGASPLEEIHNVRTAAIRAAEIVRQLMTYAGRETAHREAIDLSWLVREMLELLKVSISKHALLSTDLGQNLPAVLGNAAQLRQVVMNLIINASEAIGDQGVIQVATSHVKGGRNLAPNDPTELPEGDYLRLEVSDNGRGMTPDEQARVFDPFFTTKFAGRGLGLAVVQGIVRTHGGAMHLISSPGRGTTFQVLLPCARAQVKPDAIAVVPAPEQQGAGAAKSVLLVEDEAGLRLPVSKMLRRSGFAVLEAADGSSAIETLRSNNTIDLMLLDITIPGASSLEVLKEARRIRPDIKVILTSAYSIDMVPLPADALRVSGFIRKPFQLSELVHLIRDVLFVEVTYRAAG